MRAALSRWIRSEGIPEPGERVVVGFSGGSDSLGLLVALADLCEPIGFSIAACHVQHGIRGAAAERDAARCRELARGLGVDFEEVRVDATHARGESPEAAARRARRDALERAAARAGSHRIALGHTADDQAETVLLRALAGTSLTGLSAMRAVSGGGLWIRPFLSVRRAEVRAFLRARRIAWLEDESNRACRLPRSRLRHEIVPLLEARVNPQAVRALTSLAERAREADRALAEIARSALDAAWTARPGGGAPDEIRLETRALAAYPRGVRRYVVRLAHERLRGDRARLGATHLRDAERLLRHPGAVDLPGGVRVIGEQGRIRLLGPSAKEARPPSWPRPALACPGTTELPGSGIRLFAWTESARPLGEIGPQTAAFDAAEIRLPLRVRGPAPGDALRPFGLGGRQKVSDLLGEGRVCRTERDRVPILTDEDGILWVVGIRRSERAPVTSRTRTILWIRAEPLGLPEREEAARGALEVNERGSDDEPS